MKTVLPRVSTGLARLQEFLADVDPRALQALVEELADHLLQDGVPLGGRGGGGERTGEDEGQDEEQGGEQLSHDVTSRVEALIEAAGKTALRCAVLRARPGQDGYRSGKRVRGRQGEA